MSGLRPVAALRFREALAGGMLWLLPLHFAIAFAVVRTLPGPTLEARLQAADATALGLAAVLGLVAAAVMGASPLAAERLRARGTLVRSAPVSPAARVLGTALGTAAALLLLVGGLCASAMAAVDFGVGGARGEPREILRAVRLDTGDHADASGVYWTHEVSVGIGGAIAIQFPRRLRKGDILILTPRNGRGVVWADPKETLEEGAPKKPWEYTQRRGEFLFVDGAFATMQRREAIVATARVYSTLISPLRVTVPVDCDFVELGASVNYPRLGLRLEDVRGEGALKPRALARGLHVAALLGGLLAVMGAGMALSTVTGAGVGAGGALAMALLALFQPLFADAADTLAYAGTMEKAMEAAQQGHGHAEALTGTPPALAPVFHALAAVLPDATRFDLAAAVSANEVPYSGDVARAAALGLALCALFLLLTVLGSRRRP